VLILFEGYGLGLMSGEAAAKKRLGLAARCGETMIISCEFRITKSIAQQVISIILMWLCSILQADYNAPAVRPSRKALRRRGFPRLARI
jgi:hypothetical protein